MPWLLITQSHSQSLRSPRPVVAKRELWEQPFQACAIDADYAVKPDGQNSVISFVISELSIPAAGQKDRRLWGRECNLRVFVLWRMPEMVAPRALDSCRRPEESWPLGTRMGPPGRSNTGSPRFKYS